MKHELDITKYLCPMTFVRTRLFMEKCTPGDQVTILMQGEEPLQNLPKAIEESGHQVLSLMAALSADGVHTLQVQVGPG
jgi:tRNA 2-thiouridine synthesizing protein A